MQHEVAAIIQPFFAPDNLVAKCLEYAATQEHIMDFTRLRALGSLFSMLNQMVRNILLYNHQHADFPMQSDQVFAIYHQGSLKLIKRVEPYCLNTPIFSKFIKN